LIDEFLAKSGINNCQDFKDTAEVIAKVAFKMFLGINVDVSHWNAENTICSLLIYENPLTGKQRTTHTHTHTHKAFNKSITRICRASYKCQWNLMVFQCTLRGSTRCIGNGFDACGSQIYQGYITRR
jgi:hypothetical protein